MLRKRHLPADGDAADQVAWNLDWNLLRTFMVIVQEGSITAAAQKLSLKQPTVSNALRRLEECLGRKLVERGPRVFEVTLQGQALFREALDMFGSVNRLSMILSEMTEVVQGHITISMASHVTSPLLDETLGEFHARHPEATFSVAITSSSDAIEAVFSKRSSLGICLVNRRHPALEFTQLYREHFGFFCGPQHRLFGKRNLTLADLKGERSVSFQTDQVTDVLRPVAMLRARAGIDDTVVGQSSNLEEVKRMIIAGLGIGPLPIHVVERDVRDGQLWRLPPHDAPPAIDIFLVRNLKARLNSAEMEFTRILLEKIEATPLRERTYGLS
jgi:DNA-binding transcriptional LysR family regulator